MNTDERNRKLAIAALVLAICALVSQPFLAIIMMAIDSLIRPIIGPWSMGFVLILGPSVALLSVVLAHVARRRLRASGSAEGSAMVTAALIVAYVALAYLVMSGVMALVIVNGMKHM
jgi:hypothetical protein